MVRSECLRAFDQVGSLGCAIGLCEYTGLPIQLIFQDVVAMVTAHMEEQCGIRFLRRCEPRRVERVGEGDRGEGGRLRLTWESLADGREVQVC